MHAELRDVPAWYVCARGGISGHHHLADLLEHIMARPSLNILPSDFLRVETSKHFQLPLTLTRSQFWLFGVLPGM